MQTLKQMQFGRVTQDLQAAGQQAPRQSQDRKLWHGIVQWHVGTASVCLWFWEAGMPAGGHTVPRMQTRGVCLHVFLSPHWWPWDVRLEEGVLRLWRYWCGFLTAHLLGFNKGRSWWAKFGHFLTLFTL